jgi:hypothetical protein
MFEPFSTKCRLFREFMSLGSRNIYVFRKHAKNLNAHSEKFGELGLTTGI